MKSSFGAGRRLSRCSDFDTLEAIGNPFDASLRDADSLRLGEEEEAAYSSDEEHVADTEGAKKGWDDHSMLLHTIRQLHAFATFPPRLLDLAVDAFVLEESVEDRAPIVRSGSLLDRLYVVESGAVRVCGTEATGMRDDDGVFVRLATYRRGSPFHMAALLPELPDDQDSARTRSFAEGRTRLYSLSRRRFQALVRAELTHFAQMDARGFLLGDVPFVAALRGRGWLGGDDAELTQSIDELVPRLEERRFRSGSAALDFLRDTSLGAPFVLVKAGTLVATLRARRSACDSMILHKKLVFGRGELIGADALEAISEGKALGAISVTVGTAYVTLLRPSAPAVGPQEGAAPRGPPGASEPPVSSAVSSVVSSAHRVHWLRPSALRHSLESALELTYLRKLLGSMDCFGALSAAEVEWLIGRACRQSFEHGASLLEAGSTAAAAAQPQATPLATPLATPQAMYVVIRGSARASRVHGDGGVEVLGGFGVGEQFGANALLEDPHTAKPRTVRALRRRVSTSSPALPTRLQQACPAPTHLAAEAPSPPTPPAGERDRPVGHARVPRPRPRVLRAAA